MTVESVAYEVGAALDRAAVVAVLSGGGAATFYAPEAYQTKDLDFVLPFVFSAIDPRPILELGFTETRVRGTYARPGTPYTLEFIDGPLAVGDETVESWNVYRKHDAVLNVISPTDCVRDRLAAAIHWKDLASLSQAVAVARLHPIDMGLVERWCEREGGRQTFARFLKGLGERES